MPVPRPPKLRQLKFGRDSLDLNYYLTSDYQNIEDVANELPAVIEWVNEVTEGHVTRMLSLKNEVEETEAAVYFKLVGVDADNFKDRYATAKMTADALKHAIALDPEVRNVQVEYATERGLVERLRQLQVNLIARLDLLRSSEATRRKVFTDSRGRDD
jgi:hypothetical protein